MKLIKKSLGILLAICLILGGVPQGIVNAVEIAAGVEIKAFKDSTEVTEVEVGDFFDATIYVSDCTLTTMAIPIHFNPSVVEVWYTDDSQIVSDGVKDSDDAYYGYTGLTVGQMFDPAPIYWAGTMIYNDSYLYVDNTQGLIKTTAFRTSEREIVGAQSAFTIRFKVIAEGDPEIRFAKNTDTYYDAIAPNGVTLNNNSGVVLYDETITPLTAVDPDKQTVSFESNGGSTVESIIGYVGNTIEAPTEPTKEGFTFDEWYKEDTLTTL